MVCSSAHVRHQNKLFCEVILARKKGSISPILLFSFSFIMYILSKKLQPSLWLAMAVLRSVTMVFSLQQVAKIVFPKWKNGKTFYWKWPKSRHEKLFEMLFIFFFVNINVNIATQIEDDVFKSHCLLLDLQVQWRSNGQEHTSLVEMFSHRLTF